MAILKNEQEAQIHTMRPKSVREIAELSAQIGEFNKAIQPYLDAKVQIYKLMAPVYYQNPITNTLEAHYERPKELTDAIESLDALIDLAKRHFLNE